MVLPSASQPDTRPGSRLKTDIMAIPPLSADTGRRWGFTAKIGFWPSTAAVCGGGSSPPCASRIEQSFRYLVIILSGAVTEPTPLNLHWPRYSSDPFPAYRFVPGQTPHPRRNPLGHSYGQREPHPKLVPAAQWHTSDDYLYGIDLYNFAYWWEAHEIFEGFWHVAGRHTEQGNFFQALIQLAAANLKHVMNNEAATRKLVRAGITRLERIATPYMGIDVSLVVQALDRYLAKRHSHLPLISLQEREKTFGGEITP